MKSLTVAKCLEHHYIKVLDSERPKSTEEGFYAVYSDSIENGVFRGLASAQDVATHPKWIWADLVEHRDIISINPSASVKQALSLMKHHHLDVLAVLNTTGDFVGIVTRTSILESLLQRERTLLKNTQLLNSQIEKEREELASWSSRLQELNESSRTLLGILAHADMKEDLLQQGIEVLTNLLQARYGAIGILDESGNLKSFHYTGITPAQAQNIGHFPQGRGLLGVVIREDTPLRLENMSSDPRSAGFPPGHPPMKSLLAVPISHLGHVYGRIYLCDKQDGHYFTVDDETLAMSFAHSLSLVIDNAREIEETRRANVTLQQLTNFDVLTGLPNRKLLIERIEEAISMSERYKRSMALLFIDLDNFKNINDSMGHSAGDELLKTVAKNVSASLREGDVLARLGGDEFVVLLPEIDDPQDAATVAEKALIAISKPIMLDQRQVSVSGSIGIGVYPQDATGLDYLLSCADIAMYNAKSSGRNNFQFFTHSMTAAIQSRMKIERHLRQAIERKELCLHYQPQIDITDNRIVGVEALIRWHDQKLGSISPTEFIPIAEDSGLIAPLTEWVLETACKQAAQWLEKFGHFQMAVNISTKLLQKPDRFLEMVKHSLENSRLPPEMLELEITESAMMHKIDESINTFNSLKQLGIRISIDDFGTGYSSLSYLKRLPIDIIKIDRSFVKDIETSTDDAAIVSAIAAMARQLNLLVIVEGVETKQQLEFIQAIRCDIVQGYYFSKPMPSDIAESAFTTKYC